MLATLARNSLWKRHALGRFCSSSVDAPTKIIVEKLKHASKDGDWKTALGTFQHFVSTFPQAVEPYHANLVLRVCAAQGRHREAKKVLHTMQQIGLKELNAAAPPDADTPSSTADANATLESKALMCIALIENGKGHDALQTLHTQATEALAATSDEEATRRALNGFVYKPIIQALKNKNDWKLTLTVLHHMQGFGLPISLRGYRMLFLALASGRQNEKLVDVTNQVLRLRGDVLDVATYTVLFKTLSALGEHEAVERVLDQIAATKPRDWMQTSTDVNFYNALIRAKMLSGDMDYCLTRLKEMEGPLAPDAFPYTTCMLGFLNTDKSFVIFKLYKDMLAQGIAPSILTLALVLRAIKTSPKQRKLIPGIISTLETTPLEKADFVHTVIDALEELRERDASHAVFDRAMDENMLGEWRKAKAAVEFALHAIADQPKSVLKTELQDLKIITGKGRGSREYMKPVLKPEIITMLRKHFRLIAFSPAQNEGSLVVKKANLEAYIDTYHGE
ncbi:hypothetical protein SPRG_03641 [Saprolegnia parasitica CBS 223.65]|uniref:Smr domain-containing protein n=1 Tax=Saprolegnia parasitica (strain CBS 223.65) TaxID=695850 RepID=A0A067CM29_SAPPC|nr:hypothetical protein SPRG_03641 [Saprolegnia parasitica CBS 223.65]KDO31724.1 hypothetical protein SPRG_03641 [Saprolegnia parasitica CBS 223.65]|eukprot:XP_012197606.1 hypothetical protein SPRG_03641 [Saprolegnia parasitica CBS 223.65]